MVKTVELLAPSLYPNTLSFASIPIASSSSTSVEPILQHIPIKHGQHQPVPSVKRMMKSRSGQFVLADDQYKISIINLSKGEEHHQAEIVNQHQCPGTGGSVWAGLAEIDGSTIGALSNGQLMLIPHSNPSNDVAGPSTIRNRTVPSPITCLASSSTSSTTFSLAGKEVDVSVWDVEKTFAVTEVNNGDGGVKNGKRKKNELEIGEIWRAKNLAHDHLNLRPPIHHLCMTYHPSSSTSIFTGTKSGSIRSYDTRQRKPLHDWKISTSGIGSLAFGSDNELFYSDKSSIAGVVDIRTGKSIYQLPSTCTVSHLSSFDPLDMEGDREVRLGSISSDCTLRVYSTAGEPPEDGKWKGEGKKGRVEGMVGGVGVGEFCFLGHGEIEAPVKVNGNEKTGDDEEGDADEKDVWEEMDEVGEVIEGSDSDGAGEDQDDWDSDSEEDDLSKKKVKKVQPGRKIKKK